MRYPFVYDPGARVRVSERGHSFNGAVGTVALAPRSVARASAGWSGHQQTVASDMGPVILYWVRFDRLERDMNGDPCEAAAVAAAHLVAITGAQKGRRKGK